MGLFSSKKKIYVGTSVSRVIDDISLPNATITGVTKAILNDGDMPDYILEELVQGVGSRAERMYEYAARKYAYGLPSGYVYSSDQGQAQVEVVLAQIEGQPVVVEYSQLGPPNSLHIGWMQLIEQYGYNPETNQLDVLTALKGTPVYLNDMMVVVPEADFPLFEPGALDQWGVPATAGNTPWRPTASAAAGSLRPHSPVYLSPTAVEDFLQVEYIWEAPGGEPDPLLPNESLVDSLEIPVTTELANPDEDYFHVKYVVDGVTKYMLYQLGSGTYPSLDALFDRPETTNGTFFPMVHFRSEGASISNNVNSEAYKTSNRMLKYLGMDLGNVSEAIDSNPDVDEIQSAIMVMAVPANSTNQIEQRYLFAFFNNLFFARGQQFTTPELTGIKSLFDFVRGPASSIVIQDARFKMVLSYTGIYKSRYSGTVAAIGAYSSGLRGSEHYYRYQVSAYLYDEVVVQNLRMAYYIYGTYTDVGDGGEAILLIPLDRSITKEFSLSDREILYSRSLHYVFNSLQIVKVKWYQTSFFKAFIQVVGIIISVLLMGSDGGFFAALASGSTVLITQALVTLVLNFLTGLLITALFKLFVKAVGADLAFLIAIVAMVVGAYQYLDAGSLAGAPWAKELLQLTTGLTKAIAQSTQDSMVDLLGEYQSFELFKDDKTKELEASNKLLEFNNHLSPFVIFGESPNDFYNRTVHSSNPGVMGIGAISAYVDTALKLPKLDETIGTNTYA